MLSARAPGKKRSFPLLRCHGEGEKRESRLAFFLLTRVGSRDQSFNAAALPQMLGWPLLARSHLFHRHSGGERRTEGSRLRRGLIEGQRRCDPHCAPRRSLLIHHTAATALCKVRNSPTAPKGRRERKSEQLATGRPNGALNLRDDSEECIWGYGCRAMLGSYFQSALRLRFAMIALFLKCQLLEIK